MTTESTHIDRYSTDTLSKVAGLAARYGLVLVIAWIGALKFTAFEAEGIAPLVSESPLMSWLYDIFSVRTFSTLLGIFELTAALLIAVKPLAPKISIVGSLLAIMLFVATISFMFTTPGIFEAAAGGFPMFSMTGFFLIKDVPLLGISLWTLADAVKSGRQA